MCVSADVYAREARVGRGGWSWYTGSAGWMYRLVVESLLGLQVRGDRLSVTPLLPANWESFELNYCFGKTLYRVSVNQSAGDGVQRVVLDGVSQANAEVHLIDDGREHSVKIETPRVASAASLTLA
jgi:cyclic beta-1,2-glucan synthetase